MDAARDARADVADASETEAVRRELGRLRSWVRWLTAAVFATAVAVFLFTAAVFGAIVDYHYGEGILIGGACAGGVAMGFLFGWLAQRAMSKV